MDFEYSHYVAMQPHEIRRRLALRKLPELPDNLRDQGYRSMAEYIYAQVMEKRHELREQRARQKYVAKQWRDILDPARREFRTMKAMLNTARSRQRSGAEDNEDISQAKIAALTAYMDVIGSFLSTVETWLDKDPELSPAKRLQKKLKAFPNGVPNGGSHWVDWIPESMKQPVVQLFDAVPYRAKAKRKVPFQRRIPKIFRMEKGERFSLFDEFRYRLRIKTETALKQVESKLRFAKNDEDLLHRKAKIDEALILIDNAKEGVMLPTVWQGFFPDEDL